MGGFFFSGAILNEKTTFRRANVTEFLPGFVLLHWPAFGVRLGPVLIGCNSRAVTEFFIGRFRSLFCCCPFLDVHAAGSAVLPSFLYRVFFHN